MEVKPEVEVEAILEDIVTHSKSEALIGRLCPRSQPTSGSAPSSAHEDIEGHTLRQGKLNSQVLVRTADDSQEHALAAADRHEQERDAHEELHSDEQHDHRNADEQGEEACLARDMPVEHHSVAGATMQHVVCSAIVAAGVRLLDSAWLRTAPNASTRPRAAHLSHS